MRIYLVALDGSDHSRRALVMAVEMARGLGGSVVVLHVEDSRPVTESERHFVEVEFQQQILRYRQRMTIGWGDIVEMTRADVAELPDANVRAAIESAILDEGVLIVEAAGIPVTRLAREGSPGQQISIAAEEIGADLVLMGRRGLNRLQELLLGSVTLDVLHQSKKSVLAVA